MVIVSYFYENNDSNAIKCVRLRVNFCFTDNIYVKLEISIFSTKFLISLFMSDY